MIAWTIITPRLIEYVAGDERPQRDGPFNGVKLTPPRRGPARPQQVSNEINQVGLTHSVKGYSQKYYSALFKHDLKPRRNIPIPSEIDTRGLKTKEREKKIFFFPNSI